MLRVCVKGNGVSRVCIKAQTVFRVCIKGLTVFRVCIKGHGGIKVGLGISRTNADSQWNPVYNAFHPNFCCANETIRR